ncbi:hypothetical protein [Streptomyces sp. NPDC102409]
MRGPLPTPPTAPALTGRRDLEVLRQWLRRAATATSADEIFTAGRLASG